MDEAEKKFELPLAIILLMLTGISDIGDLAADLIFGIPVVGQVVWIGAKIFSLLVWGIIQTVLFFKGERGLWFFVGSIVDTVVPFAQTITLAITIFIANTPALATAASIASSITSLSKTSDLAKSTEESGAQSKTSTGGPSPGTPQGEQRGDKEKSKGGVSDTSGKRTKPEISEESFGLQPEPLEKLYKESFEDFPGKPDDVLENQSPKSERVIIRGNEVNLRP